MKLTTTISVCVLGVGLGWAQSPSILQNTRNTLNAVSNSQAGANAAALSATSASAPAAAMPASAKSGATNSASPMQARPAKGSKKAHAALHKESPSKPPLVEPTGTAPIPGTTAANTSGADVQESEDPAASEKAYNPNNRRDPFLSPIVSRAGGSGCSSGKKCLEIGAISLHGVVHAENGFIAVVSNGQNKAYFMRENDPVFNGYVVKITDDSIVFQETLQDRLGKTFTREVVKKITVPAV